jgi:hypothetical protein
VSADDVTVKDETNEAGVRAGLSGVESACGVGGFGTAAAGVISAPGGSWWRRMG